MSKNIWLAALLVAGLAPLARAAVELVPFRIEETRTVTLAPDKIGRTPDALRVIFSAKGPEANAAVRYGELKLDEAVDDQGTNLIPDKATARSADPAQFKPYSNAFFREFDLKAKRPAADPQIEIVLGLPKRSASRIARLRGSVNLVDQGILKTIETTDLPNADQKKLDLPAESGLSITLGVGTGAEARSIKLEMSGNENALESIEVLDAAGKKVSSGMSSWSFAGGPPHKSLELNKPLDASMKLVVKVTVGRKVTVVPLDLKDVVLP